LGLREFPRKLEQLHRKWPKEDQRWLHGKLYWFRDGRKQRLLVTSANLSQAAWGRRSGDSIIIENFELGVAFDTDWRPVPGLPVLHPGDAATQMVVQDRKEPSLAWSVAGWDGKRIQVDARLAVGADDLDEDVLLLTSSRDPSKRRVKWIQGGGGSRSCWLPWRASASGPVAVLLSVGGAKKSNYTVPVADLRARRTVGNDMFGGVTKEEADRLELALLEERYGGAWVEDVISEADESSEPDLKETKEKVDPIEKVEAGATLGEEGQLDEELPGGVAADYQVATIQLARLRLSIVAKWAASLTRAVSSGGGAEDAVLEDGRRLVQLWSARMKTFDMPERVVCRVAVDELNARMGDRA
jgi:hypothetical protein